MYYCIGFIFVVNKDLFFTENVDLDSCGEYDRSRQTA